MKKFKKFFSKLKKFLEKRKKYFFVKKEEKKLKFPKRFASFSEIKKDSNFSLLLLYYCEYRMNRYDNKSISGTKRTQKILTETENYCN